VIVYIVFAGGWLLGFGMAFAYLQYRFENEVGNASKFAFRAGQERARFSQRWGRE
jgi:hypothetical protein